jgi:hypothetical protein
VLVELRVGDDFISEYIQLGIVSPRQIKELQVAYELSHRQIEDIVSDLIAHGVCILDDDKAEHLRAVQTNVFYQDRRRYNSLLNGLPLYRLIAVFLELPDTKAEVEISSFHDLPNWRQYLRELSRLRLITAGGRKDEINLSEGFQRIQRAVHAYLENGYVLGLKHRWRRAVKEDITKLATTICQSPFFSVVVLPVVRQYYLSLPEIQKFVSWAAECQAQPPSIWDIVRYAISHGELREVWWLLLGDVPFSSPVAIEDGSDVCFKCLKIGECTPYFAGRYDRGAIRNLLRKYRDEIAAEFLQELADGNIEVLVPRLAEDAMLVKFVVSQDVVRSAKAFLGDIGVLNKGYKILRKDAGLYCPLEDIWLLERQLIKRRQ